MIVDQQFNLAIKAYRNNASIFEKDEGYFITSFLYSSWLYILGDHLWNFSNVLLYLMLRDA